MREKVIIYKKYFKEGNLMELHSLSNLGIDTVVLLDDNMKIIKPVFNFLKFQQQRGRSINTLKANGNDLRTFWMFLKEYSYAYDAINPNNISELIDYLRRGKSSELVIYPISARTGSTINRILSTVYQFYKYCGMTKEIDNPILMEDINRPFNLFKSILHHAKRDNKTKRSVFKVKESPRRFKLLSDIEVFTFYNALNRKRDKLLFKMLYLTGARIQEILDLEIESVSVPDASELMGVFQQIKSKGKYRDLYAPMSLIEELDSFILEERNRTDTEHNYIFISEQPQNLGNHLTYRGIYEVFKSVQKKIGIIFNFHDLRHTYISSLVESGMDISIIRILAGHEHISTTQKYTHLTDRYIEESLSRYWEQSVLIGGTKDV